jgi:hypothetical protein
MPTDPWSMQFLGARDNLRPRRLDLVPADLPMFATINSTQGSLFSFLFH